MVVGFLRFRRASGKDQNPGGNQESKSGKGEVTHGLSKAGRGFPAAAYTNVVSSKFIEGMWRPSGAYSFAAGLLRAYARSYSRASPAGAKGRSVLFKKLA
jgi:hypothetical protein